MKTYVSTVLAVRFAAAACDGVARFAGRRL